MTRRQLFGSLCAMVFVVNLGRVVYAPLVDHLQVALTVDAAAVGLLASLVWVGTAVPRIPTGWLLTKVSRTVVVFSAGVTLAAATGLASVAPGIRALQIAAFLMGVSAGVYFIAANPLVSELFPDGVGRALGIHGMASQVAAVGAPLFLSATLAVGTWRTDRPAAGAADRDVLGAARAQWRLILAGVVILGGTGFVWQGVFNFYVSYLTAAKSVDESTARLALSVTFGAGVPAFAISGRLADRLPIVEYLLAILGAFVVCLLALTAVSGLVGVLAVSVVVGYVVHSLFPAMDTYLLGSLPDQHRASAYAVYSGSVMFVMAGGSYAVGWLRDADVGFDVMFQSAAVVLALVLAVLLLAHRWGLVPAGARPRPNS